MTVFTQLITQQARGSRRLDSGAAGVRSPEPLREEGTGSGTAPAPPLARVRSAGSPVPLVSGPARRVPQSRTLGDRIWVTAGLTLEKMEVRPTASHLLAPATSAQCQLNSNTPSDVNSVSEQTIRGCVCVGRSQSRATLSGVRAHNVKARAKPLGR